MNRRDAVLVLCALGAAPRIISAQQMQKTYRVGWILNTAPTAEIVGPESKNFGVRIMLRELRTFDYVEGKNLILDRVSAEGHPERYPEIAAELVRRKSDVIIVPGSEAAVATKKATVTVPIVMATVLEPVKYGLVASLARPGGNFTGLAADATPETEGKRLEYLRTLMPGLSRVSYLASKWIWEGPFGEAIRLAAPALGIQLLFAEHSPADLKATFAKIADQRPNALLIANSPDVFSQRQQIINFALKARLPALYPYAEMADAGGLMSYGWNLEHLYHQVVGYVDKILKGAKPGELPVEQPTVYELVINLKTARAIGITIPPSILIRADRVIE